MLDPRPRALLPVTMVAAALFLQACGALPRPAPTAPPVAVPAPQPVPVPAPLPAPAPAPAPAPPAAQPAAKITPPFASSHVSHAITALAYRRDAATHLYNTNATRVFKGQLPPNLYAVGVLDVDIDGQGMVMAIHWRRAPSHAPEVMAEIVRTVRSAAPYPAPSRMGKVTYTDIWLWDKSGKFQLDTLTEGQL